jgi:hypothetical protein
MAEHKTQNAPTTMGGAGSIEPRQPVLPFPVTLIALFEFARAGLILFVVLSPWLGNPTYPVPKSTVQVVTLSAVFFFVPRNEVVDPALPKTDPSEEQFENVMRLLMCAPVAALFAYIGFGLMGRKKSGRALAIVWVITDLTNQDRLAILGSWTPLSHSKKPSSSSPILITA